jgi:hypothetical protein
MLGDLAATEWTFKDYHYTLTSSKFTSAEDAQDECQKDDGHLVHFVDASQLMEAFTNLKIDTVPGEGKLQLQFVTAAILTPEKVMLSFNKCRLK